MGNKITTIVGIMLAVVFITALGVMFGLIASTNNESIDALGGKVSSITNNELARFDNKLVSGKVVKDTINQFRETSNGLKMSYAVCSSTSASSSNTTYYGYKAMTYDSSSSKIKAKAADTNYTEYTESATTLPGSSSIIGDSITYKAQLLKADSGTIVGVIFYKQ